MAAYAPDVTFALDDSASALRRPVQGSAEKVGFKGRIGMARALPTARMDRRSALDEYRAARDAWRDAVLAYLAGSERAMRGGGTYDSMKASQRLEEIDRLYAKVEELAKRIL